MAIPYFFCGEISVLQTLLCKVVKTRAIISLKISRAREKKRGRGWSRVVSALIISALQRVFCGCESGRGWSPMVAAWQGVVAETAFW